MHYLADQCAMNALFSENKEKMAVLPCEWNLRSWGLNTCTKGKVLNLSMQYKKSFKYFFLINFSTFKKDDCYCSSLFEQRTCAVLHGQGSQFTAQSQHIGFYTVWKTIFDFSWSELSNRNLLLTAVREIKFDSRGMISLSQLL